MKQKKTKKMKKMKIFLKTRIKTNRFSFVSYAA
jgi:hypothetical protein